MQPTGNDSVKSTRTMLPRRSLIFGKPRQPEGIFLSQLTAGDSAEKSPFESFGTETKRRIDSSASKDRAMRDDSLGGELERLPLSSRDVNTLNNHNNSNQKSKLEEVIQSKNTKLKSKEHELHREILSLSDDLQTIREQVEAGSMKNQLAKVVLEKKKEELLQRKEIKQRQVDRVMFLLQKREEILASMLRPDTNPAKGLAGNLTVPKAILQLVTSGKVQTPRFDRLISDEHDALSERGSYLGSRQDEDSIDIGYGPSSTGRRAEQSNNNPGSRSQYDQDYNGSRSPSPEIVGNIEDIRELTDAELDHIVFSTADMKRSVCRWVVEETHRLFRSKALVKTGSPYRKHLDG